MASEVADIFPALVIGSRVRIFIRSMHDLNPEPRGTSAR
jgi:hypothetical protein